MGQIKLNYQTVMNQLDEVSQAVEALMMKKSQNKGGETALNL
ncbi:YwqI/YxiC family protein [Bacillus pumilus]|nr:YwqI/YxiC family protein [Bacillus pumilus]